MRVTNRMTTRNYLGDLNRTISGRNDSLRRMTDGRKYNRLSDNVSDSARALTVRQQTYKTEQSLRAVSDAHGPLDSAEGNLMTISENLISVKEKLISVMGTSDPSKYEITGKEIGNTKEQMLQLMNAKFADEYLFSGTNNSKPPFTVDSATGAFMFNGIPVDDIQKDDDGYFYMDAGGVRLPVPQNGDTYIDIGLGLTSSGDNIDPHSAFKTSISGLDIMGFGRDADGNPNNIFSIVDEIQKNLQSAGGAAPDKTRLGELHDKLKDRTEKFLISITDVGSRQKFLEGTKDRLESDMENLGEMTNRLELINLEEESITMKSYEAAWLMTLQLGSKILPTSLMDYLR